MPYVWPGSMIIWNETPTSKAKGQYAIHSTGISKWSSLFGIHRQHPEQETSFKVNQSYMP